MSSWIRKRSVVEGALKVAGFVPQAVADAQLEHPRGEQWAAWRDAGVIEFVHEARTSTKIPWVKVPNPDNLPPQALVAQLDAAASAVRNITGRPILYPGGYAAGIDWAVDVEKDKT